jgi:hypothetical protein
MWLSDVMDRPVIALPDEPVDSIGALAARFGGRWLVVIDERGRYPDALLGSPRHACLASDPVRLATPGEPAWLFQLVPGCSRS